MTWNAYHHRGEVLRTVISVADARRDGILPMDVDGVAETFEGELDLISALQLKWHTQLTGHIDRELMVQPMDLETVVIACWKRTAEEYAGIRAILDRYTAQPTSPEMRRALKISEAKEARMLALMAGRTSELDEPGERIGRQMIREARDPFSTARIPAPLQEEAGSLFSRLRAALAA